MKTKLTIWRLSLAIALTAQFSFSAFANHNDPCGMVPPIYTGGGAPITRTGLQQTYVFYKDGVETFVIRPGFQGKVDNFGMLIPFPSAPALRKVPDNIFPHIANAVDPPEIQVFAGRWMLQQNQKADAQNGAAMPSQSLSLRRQEVRVLKEEAVGMYEVAVLQAGSSDALKKWMDKHRYKYPQGMDKVCEEYIGARWCFVAVKTRVGQAAGVQPKPGQRKLTDKMPSGSTFDGHVQGMGFRFKTDELVVPMRLSAFNEGETRNIVYLLTDSPKKIRAIPEEFVQRQISGANLIKNVTQPLPLRIVGGTEKDLQPWQIKELPRQRNPVPFNGFARQLFAADLLAIKTKDLSMPHEEAEKELLRIGEHFGLRGPEIDADNADALKEQAEKVVADGLSSLKGMTLTVLDGDFPREVLGSRNLKFAEYRMPSRRNNSLNYDPKVNGPGPKKEGILKVGAIDWSQIQQTKTRHASKGWLPITIGLLGLSVCFGMVVIRRRRALAAMIAVGCVVTASAATAKDPCGMVPPIYTGKGAPITRIGLQQTYVFYKDGVETFVIRPGFQGKVDNFGMLIPFPSAPALRKVPDNVFSQVANAVDPPEVVVDLRLRHLPAAGAALRNIGAKEDKKLAYAPKKKPVRVLKREAVGMYEVAVLEAGSSAALKKWMDKNGFKYPKGMDKVCDEYIELKWCFVAVKTKVNQSAGVQPKAGQRKVNPNLPSGSTFDGHVQGMGFRFKTDELVVPMRLSAFNEGETRNIVYLLTDSPKKIRAIPEEYVQRQLTGKDLIANVTKPLPLRIIGGTEKNLTDWHRKSLPAQRKPEPKNGVAKQLFASDLTAIASGNLSLEHEEMEKEFLRIGEHFGLRGPEIDKSNEDALAEMADKATKAALKDLNSMTLTVLDGDFPREVLSSRNLTFATYKMPARRNNSLNYDPKTNKPGAKKQGVLKIGAVDWSHLEPAKTRHASKGLLPITFGLLGLSVCLGMVIVRRRKTLAAMIAVGCVVTASTATAKDPCGMVPPIYTGKGAPITRIGLQQTYVFYKDGVETFVIRPGFQGKVDNFGMLIPFPSPPALRKVPDNVFAQVANAVDPPEVVIDLRPRPEMAFGRAGGGGVRQQFDTFSYQTRKKKVTVLKREAVGMYEVAVLEAGSSAALKKWMDKNGFKYPKGMDKVCDEYIELEWCFVAVKTKVNQAGGVQPKAGQRKVNPNLPSGSTFDGHVQGMGFRFKTDELVVPMRLSAFNEGETRNIVYLLTDSPKKIRAIPEEYVQRQLSGKDLIANVTKPLPLRIIGGTEKNLNDWHRKSLPAQRKPGPKNGVAKQLFASDLTAIASSNLSLEHEEMEKEFLRIGEHFGLRGPEIDKSNEDALAEMADKATKAALKDLNSMTLTVLDGDFPREVLSSRNLTFATYKMPARRNNSLNYDPKTNKPGVKKQGVLKIGAVDWSHLEPTKTRHASKGLLPITIGLLGLSICLGMVVVRRRKTLAAMIAVGCVVAASTATAKDPCGMVPPIYTGKGAPITRIGLQQTYVFYKDGVETFVIRPGFQGKVDNFGMLIPFPSAPALRKVPDNVFSQVANAVDPPEVIIDLRPRPAMAPMAAAGGARGRDRSIKFAEKKREVRVLKREAVGMYEVAVLEAGSSAALKKWMDKNGFKYPKGMDKVCDEYIEARWCFVAVKTKVNQAGGVQPKAGQRSVNPNLPSGSTFDGHVQGMGFRFKTDELVVPMRLSAFNEGETRNIVYLLTDSPKKIRAIPEEYVQRQLTGKDLIANMTKPLPLRIIGGTEKNLNDWHKRSLPARRNPEPQNGVAKRLFASDLKAISSGNLSLEHEEMEKEFLRIGEHFGLRGPEIDKSNADALAEMADKSTRDALKDLNAMTLTVLDGDFPREVLSSRNLTFATYKMPARRNNSLNYDPKTNKPGVKKEGVLKIGAVDWSHLDSPEQQNKTRFASTWQEFAIGLLGITICFASFLLVRRNRR